MEKNTIEIKNKINKLYEEAANIRADISYYRTGFSFYVSTDALEEKLHRVNVEIATLEKELATESGIKVRKFFG